MNIQEYKLDFSRGFIKVSQSEVKEIFIVDSFSIFNEKNEHLGSFVEFAFFTEAIKKKMNSFQKFFIKEETVRYFYEVKASLYDETGGLYPKGFIKVENVFKTKDEALNSNTLFTEDEILLEEVNKTYFLEDLEI